MARTPGGLYGIENVMRGLNDKLRELEINGGEGLKQAAAYILNDTDKTSPKVPVDVGNLRASRHVSEVQNIRTRKRAVVFGFSANYAVFVHENVGANFKRPGAGAKFFEASLKRNVYKSVLIIRDQMTLGGTLK